MSRPFRFGVSSSGVSAKADWVELARRVEDRGYSTLLMPDHFGDQLAPVAALMAAADATETLGIGSLVWCNDYRHPVVLAKEAATLDVLSEGRLELGLGAGWMVSDYEQSGIELDRAGIRIERMAETVQILKGLFADGPVDFDGKHYQISGLEGFPKPFQKPHPPIMIGGGGRRMLTLAGQVADIVGVHLNLSPGVIGTEIAGDALAERFDEKIEWLKQGAGDRFSDIELQLRTFVVAITDDRQGTSEALAAGLGITPDQGLNSPLALVGSVEEVAETLLERRERWGLSYVVVGADEYEAFAPVVARLSGS